MQQVDQLIRTKLRLPFIRSELVPRPRLQEQIMQGLRCPLTLITAPAGFGKTTLISSCVAHCGLPVAWLSLDKDDNQAGRFLNYLTAALQGVDQQIGNEAAQLLSGMQQVSSETVLTSLVNDLDATRVEMILVLDDYQFITNPAVNTHWMMRGNGSVTTSCLQIYCVPASTSSTRNWSHNYMRVLLSG